MNRKEIEDALIRFVGSKILTIFINQKKDYLRIETDNGNYNFITVGDCCSHSWIEHLTGVSNVIGGRILKVPELHPESSHRDNNMRDYYGRESCVKNYLTKISTDKGDLEIEFRNESNGYYGGWIALNGDQYGDAVDAPESLEILMGDF